MTRISPLAYTILTAAAHHLPVHIGISVNGEGSGHTARMAALGRQLAPRHRLTFWCTVDSRRVLREAIPTARFHQLTGFRSEFQRNAIDHARTVANALPLLLGAPSLVRDLAGELRRDGVNAVISDYEPFLAIAARMRRLPLIYVCHQGVVNTHPTFNASWLVARFTNQLMMPFARHVITSSFFNGDIGPLIRPEIAGRGPARGRYLFVYARAAFREHVESALELFPRTEFRIFPDPQRDFAAELAGCSGVIAPAGHQLISESLVLRKPMLVFPQRGQYEQELNARMLTRSGWGITGDVSGVGSAIADFLRRLDDFPLSPADPGCIFRLSDESARAAVAVEELLPEAERRLRRVSRRLYFPVRG